jgi:Asp-tRNA(Asn)/Glu-tRNA(Gln) amidotransferase A subunit family amidase
VRALEARGARVVNITIPHLQAQSLAHGAQISTEFALTWDSMFHHRAEHMEDNTKVTIALAKTFSSLEVLQGHIKRKGVMDVAKSTQNTMKII